jgi:hypothetical protein
VLYHLSHSASSFALILKVHTPWSSNSFSKSFLGLGVLPTWAHTYMYKDVHTAVFETAKIRDIKSPPRKE